MDTFVITHKGKQYETWAQARAAETTIATPPAPVVLAQPVLEFALSGQPAAPASTKTRQSLTERYRPRRLAEVRGQGAAVATLSAFAADPYPTAFILAGESGTGKTSAAWALAAELGCNIDAAEFGGVHSIPSGELNVDTVKTVWGGLWQTPFDSAKGWKVLIINEVESLSGQVERLFLDRLEDIPPNTVVVFTTNNLAGLPERFVDRCIGGAVEFRAAADDLAEDARALARGIWRAETGGAIPSDVLESIVHKATSAGRLSFRRVVQAITSFITKGK